MRSLLVATSLLALLGLPDLSPPAWLDRWLHNTRSHTQEGLKALDAGEADAAEHSFDSALRLAPEDPVLMYNAGTGHLAAQDDGAADLLERARAGAPDELQPQISYNLGNAHLAGKDYGAAVAAYKESLRRRPDFEDAKVNLELALRRLAEEQRSGHSPPRETPDGQQPGDQEQSPQAGAERPPDGPRPDGAPQPEDRQGDDAAAGEQPGEGDPSSLQQFEEQPDMNAEQAASILEAVENLERQHRRAEAAERARRTARGSKDW